MTKRRLPSPGARGGFQKKRQEAETCGVAGGDQREGRRTRSNPGPPLPGPALVSATSSALSASLSR